MCLTLYQVANPVVTQALAERIVWPRSDVGDALMSF